MGEDWMRRLLLALTLIICIMTSACSRQDLINNSSHEHQEAPIVIDRTEPMSIDFFQNLRKSGLICLSCYMYQI